MAISPEAKRLADMGGGAARSPRPEALRLAELNRLTLGSVLNVYERAMNGLETWIQAVRTAVDHGEAATLPSVRADETAIENLRVLTDEMMGTLRNTAADNRRKIEDGL